MSTTTLTSLYPGPAVSGDAAGGLETAAGGVPSQISAELLRRSELTLVIRAVGWPTTVATTALDHLVDRGPEKVIITNDSYYWRMTYE